MDVIKMARELGKVIQADERYKNILEAVKKNQPEKKMVRYQTAASRAMASLKK